MHLARSPRLSSDTGLFTPARVSGAQGRHESEVSRGWGAEKAGGGDEGEGITGGVSFGARV